MRTELTPQIRLPNEVCGNDRKYVCVGDHTRPVRNGSPTQI